MPKPTAEAWAALESAAKMDWESGTLEERLADIQGDLHDGLAMRIGTNVVYGTGFVMQDRHIKANASYSILQGATYLDQDVRIQNSRLRDTEVNGASVVQGSTVIDSCVDDSSVSSSQIEDEVFLIDTSVISSYLHRGVVIEHSTEIKDSEVSNNAHISESIVQGSNISDGARLHETQVSGSTIRGASISLGDSEIIGGAIMDRTNFFNFGNVVGSGDPFYAYRRKDGGLIVVLGTHAFSSTRGIIQDVVGTEEYNALLPERQTIYLRQVRAAISFMNATRKLWPAYPPENEP